MGWRGTAAERTRAILRAGEADYLDLWVIDGLVAAVASLDEETEAANLALDAISRLVRPRLLRTGDLRPPGEFVAWPEKDPADADGRVLTGYEGSRQCEPALQGPLLGAALFRQQPRTVRGPICCRLQPCSRVSLITEHSRLPTRITWDAMRSLAPLIISGVVALATASVVQAGYTPQRPTFDYAKRADNCADVTATQTVRSACGSVDPTFNSFINTPSYGDERAFLDARLEADDSTDSYQDEVRVGEPSGEIVVVRMYVNNNANEFLGPRSTAHGTRVRLTIPTGPGHALRVRGWLSSDDAVPSPVTDTAEIVAKGAFRLEPASTPQLFTAHAKDGTFLSSDAVERAGEQPEKPGVLITNTGTPGEFEAGFDRDAVVQFRLRIIQTSEARDFGALAILAIGVLCFGCIGAVATRRRRYGAPVLPFVLGSSIAGLTIMASVLIVLGKTDIAIAGYVLTALALLVVGIQMMNGRETT